MILKNLIPPFWNDEKEHQQFISNTNAIDDITIELATLKEQGSTDTELISSLEADLKQLDIINSDIYQRTLDNCYYTYKDNLQQLTNAMETAVNAITLDDYTSSYKNFSALLKASLEQRGVSTQRLPNYINFGYDNFVRFLYHCFEFDDILIALSNSAEDHIDHELDSQLDIIADKYISLIENKAAQFFEKPISKKEEKQKKPIETLFNNDINGAYLLEGKFTNNLARSLTPFNAINEIKASGKNPLNMSNSAIITSSQDFKITTTNAADFKGLKISTSMLFDMAILALSQSSTGREVFIPLDTYMETRKLKDKKTARETVKNDLDTLFNLSISFTDKIKGKDADFKDIRIITSKGIQKSIINIKFSEEANEIIRNYYAMYIPQELLSIDNKKFPHSYLLGRKIYELKRTNLGTYREDIISVKTLLTACTTIPSYEEISKTNRSYTERIIKPFEDNLDYFTSFKWEYCKAKGEPLTQEETNHFDIHIFLKSYIKITFIDYPVNNNLMDRKQRYAELNASKPAKRSRKKTTNT